MPEDTPKVPETYNEEELQAKFKELNRGKKTRCVLPEGWISVQEYAAKHNIHRLHVFRLIKKGKLPSIKFINGPRFSQQKIGVRDVFVDEPTGEFKPPKGWLTIEKYVAKYGIARNTVTLYIRDKKLPSELVDPGKGFKRRIIKDVPPPKRQPTPVEVAVDAGWLRYKEYAAKYGMSHHKVRYLITQGRLISKTFGDSHSIRKQLICVLDAPPDEHPTKKEDLIPHNPVVSEDTRRKFLKPSTQEKFDKRRKEKIRDKYLPLFTEKAPPDRMVFTANELIDMLGITYTVLTRDWKSWGLVGRPAPEEYKHLSTGVNIKGKYVYTRRDIFRFLRGEWERIEEGTPDDIIIAAAEGVPALDGVYFNYERHNPFPLDARGFFDWVEEVDLQVESKRLSKWVPFRPWSVQREAIEGALTVNEKGDFKHKIAILSWSRGEGKTLVVSILTLFFFFNGYSETIILAGNTKDQSTFTHYDLCKSIIQHTPKLRRTPGLEIKEKYIALKTGPKEMFSTMRAVPTSVGLLPGTTRAVFTELHNLQDTKFFYDLWSSLRNVPNAMVLVDTTVARPGHLVHNLWQTFVKGEDPKIYFHHYADKHYNPEMTEEELNHFRQTMPEILFNMYFRNRWEDAAGSLFPVERITEIGVCGLDGKPGPPTAELRAHVKELREWEVKRNNYQRGGIDIAYMTREIQAMERRLVPVSSIYKLPATGADLEKIGRTFGCNFIIGVGLDRALRQSKHPGRTVMSCVARGVITQETSMYFLLDMFIPDDATLPVLADKFLDWSREYGWIDKVAVETYSSQDFYDWVSDKALSAEFCSPTYAKQKPIFFSMSNILDSGQFKSPPVPYYTDDDGNIYRGFTNGNDVFRDELEMFNYIPGETEKTGKFGSPEKHKKSGVQDDTIYSVGWGIYATHGDDLVPAQRGGGTKIISAVVNEDVVGIYGNR